MEKLAERIEKLNASMPAVAMQGIYEQLELLSMSNVAPGLTVGEQAPDFTLPDPTGREVTLSGLLTQGPVVLSFLRGSWCPYCRWECEALNEVYAEFRSLGAEVVGVSPQAAERQQFGGPDGLSFSVLTDAGLRVAREYDLFFEYPLRLRDIYIEHFQIDVAEENADGSWDLPVPATFIINKDGVIYSRLAEVNYMKRMDPLDILTVLKYMK